MAVFLPSANLELSCVLVLANSAGYVIAISTAPAVDPAMIDRRAEAFFLLAGVDLVCVPMLGTVIVAMMLCFGREKVILRWIRVVLEQCRGRFNDEEVKTKQADANQ
ncbi:hypothetical protein MRB53_038581 [Persea americana]|nr:hypothetical protein MRB53_038581 [Persea americana]